MFGTLAICYLFLGGVGAGALAVCSVIDLAWVRQPFGCAAYEQGPHVEPAARVIDFGFAAGLALVVAGAVCLLVDLGRVDRALSLFLHPHPTMLSVGAYALTVLVLLSAFAVAVRFLYLPAVPRKAVAAVQIAIVTVGVVVMLYTGLLLRSVQGVALWASLFVPALFVLSSASGGVAVVLVIALLVEQSDQLLASERMALLRHWLVRVDAMVVAVEAVCAAGFLLWAHASAHPGVAASFALLTSGNAAEAWWLGFCMCGLAVPFLAEVVCMALTRSARFGCGRACWPKERGVGTQRVRASALAAVAAVSVLIGVFCLRWSMVEAGVHRDLVLEDVPAIAVASAWADASPRVLEGAAAGAWDASGR